MAKKSFWNWIADISKPVTDALSKAFGFDDDTKKKAKDTTVNYLSDNASDEEKSLVNSVLGTNEKHAVDFTKGFVNGATDTTDWVKDQIEAETGAGTNETNKEIADQNLGFEREKFDYDKALQEKMFEREDTSYQRTVNDMRMAGLNPLNMQSTNGAGVTVATTAPQNRFSAQSTQALQLMSTIFNSALQAKSVSSNNSLQQANANLLNAQAQNQRIKNIYEDSILSASLSNMRYDNNMKYLDFTDKYNNYLMNQIMGWTNDMPEWMKQSSARLGYKPFTYNKVSDFDKVFSNPDVSWYQTNPEMKINPELSSKLLSDELLTGSLGFLGNLFLKWFK